METDKLFPASYSHCFWIFVTVTFLLWCFWFQLFRKKALSHIILSNNRLPSVLRSDQVNSADEVGWAPLHYAAWKGHVQAVKTLCQQGALPDLQEELGRTPLHLAALQGHSHVVAELWRAGADINFVDSRSLSALHKAAYAGRSEVVRDLINWGANPNLCPEEIQMTAAHLAACNGHAETIKVLDWGGADISAVDASGQTPLHNAAAHGQAGAVTVLLEAGALASQRDQDGATAADLARAAGHEGLASVLASAALATPPQPHASSARPQSTTGPVPPPSVSLLTDHQPYGSMPARGQAPAGPETFPSRPYLAPVQEGTPAGGQAQRGFQAAAGLVFRTPGPGAGVGGVGFGGRPAADDLTPTAPPFMGAGAAPDRPWDQFQIEQMRADMEAMRRRAAGVAEIVTCPITQDVMKDPVVAADGHTYEREAIERWLRLKGTSPMTNTRLRSSHLTPNYAIRSAAREWQEGKAN